ncbi:MAG: M20/M25/M40 family metallo-hydrolase, partial [Deltaproteobacteria bacterium]|nr:M20/M25/M40 family metallo-hydrolase [Deltaproteobacteria bacterium]
MRRLALGLITTLAACRSAPPPPPPPPPAAEVIPANPCALSAFLPASDAPVEVRADGARRFLARCGLAEAEALTAELVAFPTVSAREPRDGPAFNAMAEHLKTWSEARGFRFEAVGKNDAWIVSHGEGAPELAFVMHADVVPVDAEESPGVTVGWTHPPFEVTEIDGRLYGRGTEDDKGPIAAVLVVLHTLKRFDLLPAGQVQAIMGTGEEHDWAPMAAFAKSRPQASTVISLDAGYPVVIAESGFVAWTLALPKESAFGRKKGCIEPLEVSAGQFLTQVPGEGRLALAARAGLAAAVKAAADAELTARGEARFSAEAREAGDQVVLDVHGEAVHSSTAEDGANALWLLSGIAGRLDLCGGGIRDMLALVHRDLDGDHHGKRLGLFYAHPLMGELLVIPTVLRSEGEQVTLQINMRRPAGKDDEAFDKALTTARLKLAKDFA